MLVEGLHDDAGELGLTEGSIETLARSRLRAARIYTAEMQGWGYFYVNIFVVGRSYYISLELNKRVSDDLSQHVGAAKTWDIGGGGIGDRAFIMQGLSEYMDTFIDEYLRVNADACE